MAEPLSLTGHIYGPAVTIMSRPAYDKLSDADKQAFVESAQLAAKISRNDVERADDAGIAQLLGFMKINVDVDKAAFRAALAPAYAEWRQRFDDLIDRIQAHHATAR
jgi:TRAP-type C4-dicarboxylate transport system substrate-binding protein